VRRATAPDHLERIANHPRVRPFIGGSGEFRAGESWDRTIALEWDEGGVVFLAEAPGVYSAHLVFLPKTKDVAGKVRAALDYLMPDHADRVLADFPSGFRHVRRLAERIGFTHHHDAHGWAHYVLDEE
jgi:hypothetical protein